MPALVNLPSLIDDARCFELVRQHRWPDGVRCPHCEAANVARDGRDDAQPHRQRYRCVGSVSFRAKMPWQCHMLRFCPLMNAIFGITA